MSQSVLSAKQALRRAEQEVLAAQGKLASALKKDLDLAPLQEQVVLVEKEVHQKQIEKDLVAQEYLALVEEARTEAAARFEVVQQRESQRAPADREEYEAAVGIKMLSGDIHAVGIRWNWNQGMLKSTFIRVMRYNPTLQARISLLDAEGQPVLPPGRTWKEKYESIEEIPLLYAFIAEEPVDDREPKLKLVRTILKDKKIRTALDDDEIWSLYSSWNMTYLCTGRTNRYIKLVDFVHAHPEVFIHMTPLELEELERVEQEKQEQEKMEQKIRTWIQFRRDEIYYVQIRSAIPTYLENKERHRLELIDILQKKPDWSVVGDSETRRQNRQQLRHHFTIQELIDLGMKPQNISNRWEVVEWIQMTPLADAYEAAHPPCAGCGKYHTRSA